MSHIQEETLCPYMTLFNCLIVGLIVEDKNNGREDEVYVMQASLYFSEQERKDAMMLCNDLRLEKAFQAWTRALGLDASSKAGKTC